MFLCSASSNSRCNDFESLFDLASMAGPASCTPTSLGFANRLLKSLSDPKIFFIGLAVDARGKSATLAVKSKSSVSGLSTFSAVESNIPSIHACLCSCFLALGDNIPLGLAALAADAGADGSLAADAGADGSLAADTGADCSLAADAGGGIGGNEAALARSQGY